MRHIGAKNYLVLWINSGVISAEEFDQGREAGLAITNFTGEIDTSDRARVEDAIATIVEHYPNELIWFEHVQ